ncbi:hypothetical protein GH721_04575 [Kriegella sp. EG-1]|nr:hypothetical protein [Flavobacteriaceae bacterium EG-1]
MLIKKSQIAFYTLLLFTCTLIAQVKIGDDVSTIHDASLFELESTSKAFVLTRVTNAQMLNIVPLSGALVYNIDANCVYAYDGNNWQNLCDNSSSSISLIDNEDGSFTLTTTDGTNYTIPNFSDLQGETGPPGPPGEDGSAVQQEQTLFVASYGQTQFTTPVSIVDSKKIEVYRNGVRIEFITIDENTIELASDIICYEDDNIRIVQLY